MSALAVATLSLIFEISVITDSTCVAAVAAADASDVTALAALGVVPLVSVLAIPFLLGRLTNGCSGIKSQNESHQRVILDHMNGIAANPLMEIRHPRGDEHNPVEPQCL
jgi:hypothetical protein